eukprot:COSAG04_NODE_245_length_18929_cov_6.708391_2_plen_157_part_00
MPSTPPKQCLVCPPPGPSPSARARAPAGAPPTAARPSPTARPLPQGRLRKELIALSKDPLPNIEALPCDDNILEWHYMIRGPKGSPFEGGMYHGKLRFPSEYPFKPPAIYMITPNGRFKPNTKLWYTPTPPLLASLCCQSRRPLPCPLPLLLLGWG